MNADTVAMSRGMLKIMNDRSESCTFVPLRMVRMPPRVGSTSSGVTTNGPSGVESSHALPCIHWWVLYW